MANNHVLDFWSINLNSKDSIVNFLLNIYKIIKTPDNKVILIGDDDKYEIIK